jgi:hypothetical protein
MREAARLVKVKRGDTVETITKHEAIIRRLLQSAIAHLRPGQGEVES